MDRRHHHAIITGPGRAGTTFLVHLLTSLGLDTGYRLEEVHRFVSALSNAGLEQPVATLHSPSPYILKNPLLCDGLRAELERGDVAVDVAIVAVRDLDAASRSRQCVSTMGSKMGCLWGTTNGAEQADVLARKTFRLLVTLAEFSVPTILVHFPRMVRDADYLFERLQEAFGGLSWPTFARQFARIADPQKVHFPCAS